MSPSSTSRVFAIIRYVFLSAALVSGMFYTYSWDTEIHLYVYSVFIGTLLCAAFCALRYHAAVERVLLVTLIIYNAFVIVVCIVFSAKLYWGYAAPYFIIVTESLIFFVHRYYKVSWLINLTKKYNKGKACCK